MPDGKTLVYGIIGDPVDHSLSPLIHNSIAEMFNQNFAYMPFPVKTENLEEAVKGAWSLGIRGLNVTAPHKENVIKYLCEVEETAGMIGAVNTLLWTPEGYKGFNTDIYGLDKAFANDGFDITGGDVILLGAGGASKAVGILFAKKKAGCIYILNRTIASGEALKARINGFFPEAKIEVLGLNEYDRIPNFFEKKFNVVQATSVGLNDPEKAPIYEEEFYKHVNVGYDINYNPLESLFMKKVREQGGTAFNGLHMLLSQAVGSYEIWQKGSLDE